MMSDVERAFEAGWRPLDGTDQYVHPVLSPQATVSGCLRASEAYESAVMTQDGYVDSETLLPRCPDALPLT
jgi:hypothetical protein